MDQTWHASVAPESSHSTEHAFSSTRAGSTHKKVEALCARKVFHQRCNLLIGAGAQQRTACGSGCTQRPVLACSGYKQAGHCWQHHAPIEPALLPDTTRGSRFASSSARTTPKCLRAKQGKWQMKRYWRQRATVVEAAMSVQQASSPHAKGAAAAEHQAGAAVCVAQLPQEGQPVIQRHICTTSHAKGDANCERVKQHPAKL